MAQNFKRFDRIATTILSVTVLLGLVAFVPGGSMAGDILKGYVLVAGALLSFVFWLIGRLVEGAFHIPKSKLVMAVGIFALAALVSAMFSHVPYLSFFGQGFDQGSAFSLIALALMSFLASVLVSSKKRLVLFLSGFFATYVLSALFQLAHLFFPAATSFGALSGATGTLLGSWVDFAYLSGAALTGFALILSFFKPAKPLKIFAIAGGILALFFIVLIGSRAVYALVGISAIAILTYKILAGRGSESPRFPAIAFVLALFMLFLFLTSSVFGGLLASKLGASYTEAHPNLAATLTVAHASLYEHPIVGPGPNDFLSEWIAHRPTAFNQSAYWDTPFAAGASFFVTTAFLGGIVGILGVLALLAAFLYECFRHVFRVAPEKEGSTLVFGAFVMTAYMLAILLVATPTVGLTIAAFFFLGLFLAALEIEKRVSFRELPFLKEYRGGFRAILSIVLLLILGITGLTFATKRLASEIYFAKGSHDAAAGNFTLADTRFASAIALSDMPKYEQARTILSEQYLQSLLSQSSSGATLTDSVKAEIQNAIAVGSAAAQRSVAIDPTSAGSYIVLGDFTRLLAPLKIQNALTSSEAAYQRALAIAPGYPKTYLDLGELYSATGDPAEARSYAKQALALKSNYTDAYFLLAQLDSAAGDTASEQSDLQAAAKSDTTDANALLALGEFQYSEGSYSDAVNTLESVLTVSRNTVDAWYYLALADAKTGNTTDAAKILSMLHSAYPNNTDVSSALIGLSAPAPTPTPTVPAKPAAPKAKK